MDFLPALESSWNQRTHKHICVIGGGPSGLAALKIIRDSQQFKDGLWTATAFEARNQVGGVWLPAPPTGDPPETPLYDSLTTNLPHPVMAYTSFPFPAETPLFPPASTVLKYMEDYAAHFELGQHIRLSTPVLSVVWDHPSSKWTVVVQPPGSSAEEAHAFDYVIVANGHYRLPRLPTTPGLSAWLEAKKAMHSVYYRNPADFGDATTVLVVGGGPSGIDLVTDLLASGRSVVHSVSGAAPSDQHGGRLKLRGRVAQYSAPDARRVVFADGSAHGDIDRAVLATGYRFSFPFLPPSVLRPALPPAAPPLPSALYNSTYHLFPLARHVFPLVAADAFPAGTLAFLGIPIRVAPLPLLEAQMRAVLHVFAYPASLDAAQEAVDIVSRYEALRAQVSAPSPSLPATPSPAPPATSGSGPDSGSGSGSGSPVPPAPIPETAPAPEPEPEPDTDTDDARTELAIAAAWHRFDAHEQFQYRDALHALAGHAHRVPAWEVEMYDAKGVLREAWRALERRGEAAAWVRGVGAGAGERGTQEWVAMMRRLIASASASTGEGEQGQSRL